ncbi:pseudouridine synthase [Maribacter sp. PR1]|uniref:Pseudouridine synthase n=1 Tax=Maribacter cobaltidurans TaxID=1178778 RepID=A0ABU7ISD1_9FLAO|nr:MULTISPECIES: pseudouridine synthase [Maribacter]MDC6388503.1 pseudouridine synthase [Maribacter sp. PR1]MEE1975892.1 pseudouridine synthase [Maribacter cobaltidurans]
MIHHHYKIYKPFGMLSQLTSGEERQLRKKRFLGELYDFPTGTMPVGRLDEKSEGLLLMTTDGKLANHVNNTGIEKEYWVQLDGEISHEAIEKLKDGVSIGIFGKPYTTKPCCVDHLHEAPKLPPPHPKLRIGVHRPTSWISIILTEGKFRQIRKMTAAVGFPTLRLIRVRIGDVHLNHLALGSVTPVKLKSFVY